MTREEMLRRRQALEEIVGPFDYDDPDYDDKRAFILFGAKDPNATWESLRGKALSPEMEMEMERQAQERREATAWAIWHAYNAE